MKTEFTKGEWKVYYPTAKYPNEMYVGDTDGLCHVTVHFSDNELEEGEANAKLIAAAPDLFKALINANKILGAIDGHMDEILKKEGFDSMAAYVDAKEAIRKATE